MAYPSGRVASIALGAMLLLVACSTPAAPAGSASSSSGTQLPTNVATSASPSSAPAFELSGLAGDWVASTEDVRLNYATGRFVGGTITVDGAQIRLQAGALGTGTAGKVGPVPITLCNEKTCQFTVGDFPSLITVLRDGRLAVVDIMDPTAPINAGAGLCDAPVVDDAGVLTISPDGNVISFVNGSSGAIGEGAGDACAGNVYQIVWTQVLTRAT